MTPQQAITKHLLAKGWRLTTDGYGDYKHPKAHGAWLVPRSDNLEITIHTVDPHYMTRNIPYADPEIFKIIDNLSK